MSDAITTSFSADLEWWEGESFCKSSVINGLFLSFSRRALKKINIYKHCLVFTQLF